MALTKDQKKIKELEEKIVQLESNLKSANEWKDRYYQQSRDYESQINDIHAMLDEFPNAPARKRNSSSYSDTELTIQSRLSAWFSSVFIATATGTPFLMKKLSQGED